MSPTEIHIAGLKAVAGVWVTFQQDGVSRRVRVVPATSIRKDIGEDGQYTEIPVDDWIVLVRDMPNPKQPPQQGDSLTIGVTGSECAYRVMHPDKNTPCFENFNQLDRPAKAWLIHTLKAE